MQVLRMNWHAVYIREVGKLTILMLLRSQICYIDNLRVMLEEKLDEKVVTLKTYGGSYDVRF